MVKGGQRLKRGKQVGKNSRVSVVREETLGVARGN